MPDSAPSLKFASGAMDDLLAQALNTASAATPPASLATAPSPSLADQLRVRLALRSWVNPNRLLVGENEAEAAAALNAVAPEVETSFALRPGEWYLCVTARKRLLTEANPAVVKAELDTVRCPTDQADPVRVVLRQEFGLDPKQALAELSVDELRALGHVRSWREDAAGATTEKERIEAELSSRLRNEDLARITSLPMLGRRHKEVLALLTVELSRPIGHGISATYVYGNGGSGKSTLLAFLQRDLARLQPHVPVVRLDFDDPFLNARDPISLDLMLFDQLGKVRPDLIAQFSAPIANLRSTRLTQHAIRSEQEQGPTSPVESFALESVESYERSERDSILFGQLGAVSPGPSATPLVLILDTTEVVITQGNDAILELAKWLKSLVDSLLAQEVRIVFASRDPADYPWAEGISETFARFGINLLKPMPLPEIDVDEATQLLINAGVEHRPTAAAAAAVLPGNPLLLRIAAEVLTQSGDAADDARRLHQEGRIDAQTARAYLTRRIVAHLADTTARPYLLPSMYLPLVTRELLRQVVIPVVDRLDEPGPDDKAARVYSALLTTRWLTRPMMGGDAIEFHRDIRSLILRLLSADPAEIELRDAIHTRAIGYHSGRVSDDDRAFEAFHRWLLGEVGFRLAEPLVARLGNWFSELPVAVLQRLQGSPKVTTDDAPAISDKDWQAEIEGTKEQDGQGERLVKRGHAVQAIELYRSRPTRPPGLAPTFMVQALADAGDWDAPELDIDPALDELERLPKKARMSGASLSRLYWITRLELLRRDAVLTARHAGLIEDWGAGMRGSSLTTMPALVAVAEAGLSRRLSPPGWDKVKGSLESVTRLFLVHGLLGTPVRFKPHIEALVVTQRDWTQRLRKQASGMVKLEGDNWIQSRLDKLHNLPFADVAKTMREFEKAIEVSWDGRDASVGVLVLRGQTTEFLRPLRRALCDVYLEPGGAEKLMPVLERLVERMSIRPADFSPDSLARRLQADAEGWFAGVVGYADRCRLLPVLCQDLKNLPGDGANHQRLVRVAQSFLCWDRALSAGTSSAWH